MEKLFDYIKDNLLPSVMIIIGIFAPGIGTIFMLDKSLYQELDIIKLICLAVAITLPSLCVVFLVLFECGELIGSADPIGVRIKNNLVFALFCNGVIFYLSLIMDYFVKTVKRNGFVIAVISATCFVSVVFLVGAWIKRCSMRRNNEEERS